MTPRNKMNSEIESKYKNFFQENVFENVGHFVKASMC